jgi:hypothetical protein
MKENKKRGLLPSKTKVYLVGMLVGLLLGVMLGITLVRIA